MDQIRTWRHTFGAVQALSFGTKPVGDRLRDAYFEHLKLISPNPDVPLDLQAEYQQLMSELGRLYPNRRVRKVEKEQGRQLALEVVAFYEKLLKTLRVAA